MTLRIGTRASALATTQAATVAREFDGTLVTIQSEGDRTTASLASLGGTGVFATALRDALRAGEIDAIVHSFKDLPTAPAQGLVIAAVPPREDARDALCARDGLTLQTLPEGARVGTGSPRRRAQLAAARPDLVLVDIRGNVDTRLGRVAHDDAERRLDAVVLAAAGLLRLGRDDAITELLPIASWPTAPAQGALAVETRAGDEHTVARIDDADTRTAVDAERAVLAILEAGCAAPIGAHASVIDGTLSLHAAVYRPDGTRSLDANGTTALPDDAGERAAAAWTLAQRLCDELLDAGAADLAGLGTGR